jgi:hypothetical protein
LNQLLISPIENFILLSTLFALVCFTVAGGVHLLTRYKVWTPRTYRLIQIYTWAIVLPPALAAWVVAAAFLPEWWTPEIFQAAHGTQHELHLLGDLTAKIEPTLAYMMFTFAAGAALFAAWSGWQSYVRVGQVITRLQTDVEPAQPHHLALLNNAADRYGLEVGLVPSDYPISFVWGFSRSRLIVSTGLLRTLNEQELTGLLEHEAVHHQRRDNLIKLALSFCTYASLAFPFTRALLKWRALQVERLCDEVAASRTNAPLDIASALVKLSRRTSPAPLAASSFIADDSSGFHERVSALIETADRNDLTAIPAQRTRIARVITFSLLFVGSLLISGYFSPLGFHRAAESLIHLFT